MNSKNIFRPRSLRLRDWNYSSSGWYYVTICIQNRLPLLGTIDVDAHFHPSPLGLIVEDEWLKTAKIRSNTELDEYSVMPDHFHGIIIIENDDAPEDVTKKDLWQKGCLGSIINQFKGACTKRIQEINSSFAWQRNFNDHIIRNQKDLDRIREYIQRNPETEVYGDQL